MTAQKKALLLFGTPRQLRKLAEECAELAAAALRLSEGDTKERRDHFFEEAADVEIVLDQMKIQYGEIDFAAWRARKLARLEGIVGAQSGASAIGDEIGQAEACIRAEKKGRKEKRVRPADAPATPVPVAEGAITIAEAEKRSGVSRSKLNSALDRGVIPYTVKPGKGRGLRMVLLSDVEAYRALQDQKHDRARTK
jgi:hypothetical protein